MCSLFGLIDFKECLSTHTKNKILNTLARECQVRGTDATGIAYNFNDRLRIYFGADYGIAIESAPYEGTTVTIRTPRVPEDREGDYDKNH